jgi:hypothetical protein
MHFEILVEDQSGKRALEVLIPKIIATPHTWRIIPYKGIGRIPKNLSTKGDPSKRILLQRLPELLRGYGKTFAENTDHYAVFLVCDLDDRCLKEFRQELLQVLNDCHPRPHSRFCIAVEEGEAWLLGDLAAVRRAYPKAKNSVLDNYENDSICGTWELLANAVYPGGALALQKLGWQSVGAEKSKWAESISRYIDVENNQSLSFCYFRGKLREMVNKN